MTVCLPVVPTAPVRLHRRVRWSECDPAGVVYTARFSDYVLEASHDFMSLMIGTPLQARLAALDLGTPAKSLQFVFHRSLYPDDEFELEMQVADIRTRSFDLALTAFTPDNARIFEAKLGLICVHHQVRASRPIPVELKERLQAFRVACASASITAAC